MSVDMGSSSSLKDFKDLKLIGKGSFGRVFRAIRPSDNMEYAIKEVNIKAMSQREREDAVNEVRILASVHHQMVIRYYDAFIESDKLYIVTELAKGGDIGAKVKRHLQRKELMSEEMIWGFFIQICQGLRNLHKANILHRDIKSQNIFLVTAREVKIGDLGVAKITKGGMAHTQIGTPYYMSPEIWRNRPYNKKSDIWSLGCLLYELSALRHPFEARDEKSLAEKVTRGVYGPIPAQYSQELATVVKMMLVVDPARRPSVEEILDHPFVQARIADAAVKAYPEVDSPPPSSRHLQTIRVPRQLSQLQSKLPASKYPVNKPGTAQGKRVTPEAAPSIAGGGDRRPGGARGVVAQSVDDVAMRQAKMDVFSKAVAGPARAKDDLIDKENRGNARLPSRLPDIDVHNNKAGVAVCAKLPFGPPFANNNDPRIKGADRPIPSRYANRY